jgi:hypothetical protein
MALFTCLDNIHVDLGPPDGDLVLVGNLVVPRASIVHKPFSWSFPMWPTQEAATALFKQLFGVRKRKVVADEEDEPPPPAPVVSDSESEVGSDADWSSDSSEGSSEEDSD